MGLKDNIFEALVSGSGVHDLNPAGLPPFPFSDKAIDNVEKLAEDLSGAIVKWVEAQTFTIEEAEATIQIPPISAPVVGATAAGGPILPGAIATVIFPPGNAVIKATKLGTPSNQSPQANVKSQSSKVRLVNIVARKDKDIESDSVHNQIRRLKLMRKLESLKTVGV